MCTARPGSAKKRGHRCRDQSSNTSSRYWPGSDEELSLLVTARTWAPTSRQRPRRAYAPNRLSLTQLPAPTDKIIVTPGTRGQGALQRPRRHGVANQRAPPIYRKANGRPLRAAPSSSWGRLVLIRVDHDGYFRVCQRTLSLKEVSARRRRGWRAPTPSPTIMRGIARCERQGVRLTKTALAIPTAPAAESTGSAADRCIQDPMR